MEFFSGDRRLVHLIFLFLTPAEQTDAPSADPFPVRRGLLRRPALSQPSKGQDAAIRPEPLLHHEKGGKEAFFPLAIEDIFRELGSDAGGLTEEEAVKRLGRYGPNVLRQVRGKPLVLRFTANLTNMLALLLWAGGALSFVADMPELGWAIFCVIIINAVFSFWQEYKAERALEALKRLLPPRTKVLSGRA